MARDYLDDAFALFHALDTVFLEHGLCDVLDDDATDELDAAAPCSLRCCGANVRWP